MKRSILAMIAGLAVWTLVASLLNRGLRVAFDGYTAAEATLSFTLGMKVGRLLLAAIASVAAGAATRRIAPSRLFLPWVLGAVILAMFVPVHIQLWSKFPVWYHLTFLGTLAPLVALGGRLAGAGVRSDGNAKLGVVSPNSPVV